MSFKFNPFTGTLDWTNDEPQFSFSVIPEDQTVRVRENQQMVVHGPITIDGLLLVDGQVVSFT